MPKPAPPGSTDSQHARPKRAATAHPFDRELELYLHYLTAERRLSRNTISAYQADLAAFFLYLYENRIKSLAKVSARQIRGWLTHCHQQGIGSRSNARRISALRGFFLFLSGEGLLPRVYMLCDLGFSYLEFTIVSAFYASAAGALTSILSAWNMPTCRNRNRTWSACSPIGRGNWAALPCCLPTNLLNYVFLLLNAD